MLWSRVSIRIAQALLAVPACAIAAGGSYRVLDTGIPVNGPDHYRWCGKDRVIVDAYRAVSKADPLRPSTILNVSQKNQHAAILLSDKAENVPVDSSACSEAENVGWLRERQATQTLNHAYVGPLGGKAVLVATLTTGGVISLGGKYIVGGARRVQSKNGYELDASCDVYHRSDYRVLCWNVSGRVWPLMRFVLTQYSWRETVLVEGQDGSTKTLKNMDPQPIGPDGIPKYSGVALRDFDFRVVADLSGDQKFIVYLLGVTVDPDEMFAYAPCIKKGASRFDEFWGVCRYRLDGKPNQWEEVFSFDAAKGKGASIGDVDVAKSGDVFFAMPGASDLSLRGIWRFVAATRKFDQLTRAINHGPPDKAPRASPDGKYVLFVRGDELYMTEQQGGIQ